jgi:hypothetical protein
LQIKSLFGWKTKRKIIVFESDDWGSFRFKNNSVKDKYIKKFDARLWMHNNDTFESFEDVSALSDVINSNKGSRNRSACFTFLMNPANPDFKKIEADNFKSFYSETFLETLKKRNDGKQIFSWYKNALQDNLIEVGFHGREHLNVNQWMTDLRNGNEVALKSFKDRVWGLSKIYESEVKSSYRSTFDINSLDELKELQRNIKEGLGLLNKTFNQKTTYFLPPDGPYHLDLNQTLADNGIEYIGLAKLHNNPLEHKWYHKKLFWLGKQTKEGLNVITRNVMFEPSSPMFKSWVAPALNQIEEAFKNNKPAVISTHRANYVSTLNPQNRENGLNQLKTLLHQIKLKWPEVEFMTSSELGQIIKESKHAK